MTKKEMTIEEVLEYLGEERKRLDGCIKEEEESLKALKYEEDFNAHFKAIEIVDKINGLTYAFAEVAFLIKKITGR